MRRAGLLLPISLLLAGCWFDNGGGERPISQPQEPPKSLYERLGQEKGIKWIVDEWTTRTLSDPRVNFIRRGTEIRWTPADSNIARFKADMVEFLCAATGGPQKYQGREMKSIHQGMQISGGEFDAMKKDLQDTLTGMKVGEKEQDELFKVIESVRKDIVEVP